VGRAFVGLCRAGPGRPTCTCILVPLPRIAPAANALPCFYSTPPTAAPMAADSRRPHLQLQSTAPWLLNRPSAQRHPQRSLLQQACHGRPFLQLAPSSIHGRAVSSVLAGHHGVPSLSRRALVVDPRSSLFLRRPSSFSGQRTCPPRSVVFNLRLFFVKRCSSSSLPWRLCQLLRAHVLYSASHGHHVGCLYPSSPNLPTIVLPTSDLSGARPNALLGCVLLWHPYLPSALAHLGSSRTLPSTHAVSTTCSSTSMICFSIVRYLRRSSELFVVRRTSSGISRASSALSGSVYSSKSSVLVLSRSH
jgi:hypothetical protein